MSQPERCLSCDRLLPPENNGYCLDCDPAAQPEPTLEQPHQYDDPRPLTTTGIAAAPASAPQQKCKHKFSDDDGQILLCQHQLGHKGPHESGDWEWWDEASEVPQEGQTDPTKAMGGDGKEVESAEEFAQGMLDFMMNYPRPLEDEQLRDFFRERLEAYAASEVSAATKDRDEQLRLAHLAIGGNPSVYVHDKVARLRSIIATDNERLMRESERAGVTWFGCDTVEHMADRILDLEAQMAALSGEPARPIATGPCDACGVAGGVRHHKTCSAWVTSEEK